MKPAVNSFFSIHTVHRWKLSLLLFLLSLSPSLSAENLIQDELEKAILRENLDAVKFFIRQGASSSRPNQKGAYPLHIAAKTGSFEIAKFLSEHSGKPDPKEEKFKVTPLHISSYLGNETLTKYLIEKKAELNHRDELKGFTALHFAAENSRLNTIKALLEAGAEKNIKDKNGKTFIEHLNSTDKDYMENYLQVRSEEIRNSGCRDLLDGINELGLKYNDTNHITQGEIFEKIYLSSDESKREYCIMKYILPDPDKFYWISIFLFDEEYTKIKNFSLAEKLLGRAENFCKEESCVPIFFIHALVYWRQNKKTESKKFFEKAIRLSEKYPGNIPAIKEDERKEIHKYLGLTEKD